MGLRATATTAWLRSQAAILPQTSRDLLEVGEGAPVQADEGWTKRVTRGTTTAPHTSYPPDSVQPDDGTLLWFDRIRVSNYTCVCNPRPHCVFFITRKRENGKRSAQD